MVDFIKNVQQRLKAAGITVSGNSIPRAQIKAKLEELKLDITADNFEEATVILIDAFTSKSLAIPETPVKSSSNKLTISEKQTLIKIEASQLGIELSDVETLQLVDSQQSQTQDTIQFLSFVRDELKKIQVHKTQQRGVIQSLVSEIGELINDANLEDAKNIEQANKNLRDIVDQCKSQAAAYSNPYANRLESIREGLRARQAS